MNSIIVALKGLIFKNGQLLIVKRSQNNEIGAGTWETVGGKMEFGEDFEMALKREFLEEVGLEIKVKPLLYATTFFTAKTRQLVLLTYLCENISNTITLSSEHEQFMWAAKDQALELLPQTILEDFFEHGVFNLKEFK
ncbi:NUDIX domain-containing protein [Rummeliibacillus sp. NPDC094406]|uniref:NUDIX hydrolase n=1 Tax=Rummeliibacillus sp. NPDC094406 TaxID=3364511 RepID=UPI0038198FE3